MGHVTTGMHKVEESSSGGLESPGFEELRYSLTAPSCPMATNVGFGLPSKVSDRAR